MGGVTHDRPPARHRRGVVRRWPGRGGDHRRGADLRSGLPAGTRRRAGRPGPSRDGAPPPAGPGGGAGAPARRPARPCRRPGAAPGADWEETMSATDRMLDAANQRYGSVLQRIPPTEWPPAARTMARPPREVWRSREFLVQVYQEGLHARLTVCRTDLNPS